MPEPKQVYDCPSDFWEDLTATSDVDFEAQHFDRKEAGRPNNSARLDKNAMQALLDEIAECISAFANANTLGGLLVLGISKHGRVKGIQHLTDDQRMQMTNLNQLLKNQTATARFVDCVDEQGQQNRICLIFVPYSAHAICETVKEPSKAWMRQGAQNILLNQERRDQIKRDKRIVDFERQYCCPFDPSDVDNDVLQEFRRSFLTDAAYEYSDVELLHQAGAIVRNGPEYAFTRAGLLFFAKNPQRELPAANIRLLRFEATHDKRMSSESRGLPTFERSFAGPITKQIRDLRDFFRQSGFFKLYQYRNLDGGFAEEPEYPVVAVDEAIVNAVAHRDYAVGLPIECEAYTDALVVSNAGRLLQRDFDVPPEFSLDSTVLVSMPRNPKLVDWLKLMRDTRGNTFLRALSEGTKTMRDAMSKLDLPAPEYKASPAFTTVTLLNHSIGRDVRLRATTTTLSTEFTNLFPITVSMENQDSDEDIIRSHRREIMDALSKALGADGWYIDHMKFSRIVAHRRGDSLPSERGSAQHVRLYPAMSFQLREYWRRWYLCLDYTLEVKNVRNVASILATAELPSALNGRSATVDWKGWRSGRILAAGRDWTRVYLFDTEQEQVVPSQSVIPNLPNATIQDLLVRASVRFDLPRAIKEGSLALQASASRERALKSSETAEYLASAIFPLMVAGNSVFLNPQPEMLTRDGASGASLRVLNLQEPVVQFNHQREDADIREGVTRFGAYDSQPHEIELVPICITLERLSMVSLIERLRAGKYRYHGAERTFSTRLTYSGVATIPSPEDALAECTRLTHEHPGWVGNQQLNRIFLVHTPEEGYSSDDVASPYYKVKRFLLERGIPCQMVDTPTLRNPDFKDLNLALNIVSKCGITPWVLPGAMPDADFFVGLSFTQQGAGDTERLMGYAHVFNEYGRWMFYAGNTDAFPYSERTEHFGVLVRETLERLNLSETPIIHFHYSAKFSREDRVAILEAARSVRPNGLYVFVWVNSHHNVRLYDSRVETDGSLTRGSYVVTAPNQFYLSTTGNNPFRKTLGTPVMLEINVRTEGPRDMMQSSPDLRTIATHVLSLTKLNWASTDSLCAEPITIKYAGDIAYLTAAFQRQGRPFKLHPALEHTPWFL